MLTIGARQALTHGAIDGPTRLVIDGGRLISVVTGAEAEAGAPPDVSLTDGTLTPGLLDLQINGSFGVDFADAATQQWTKVLGGLAARGVTGIEPTVITAPLEQIQTSFEGIRAARLAHADDPVCRILGAHLEGPFISAARKGAHRPAYMLDPSPDALDILLGDPAVAEELLTITLAPELPHALSAIRRLVAAGIVVSVGHTDATAAEIRAAADAGATMTTHIFNAQRPLGHREPGVPGAVLADERYFVGIIVDTKHVDPSIVKVVFQAASGRAIAVTDAIVTAGLPNHTPLEFGGLPVANDDTGLGRRPDGTIAGAGIVLDEGVRRMIAAGLDPAAVLASCTEVAARSIGRGDIGRLAPGATADLVWWDTDWHPRRVWLAGVEITDESGISAWG